MRRTILILLSTILVLGLAGPAQAATKVQVNTTDAQTLSNKTFDNTNSFSPGLTITNLTLITPMLTAPTLNNATLTGALTLPSGLAVNGMLYVGVSNALAATGAPTNGQLLCGVTGGAPVLCAIQGSASVTVTTAPGSISIDTIQPLGSGSAPTFSGLTLSGLGLTPGYLRSNLFGRVLLQPVPIPCSDGGTGVAAGGLSPPSNGALLIGNGLCFTLNTLTAGAGVTITNGGGAITIASSVARSYLAGCIMSTAGASATMTISACQATDSVNAQTLTLLASINKTTAAWAAGSGTGGLDTGSIAPSTWYSFYVCNGTVKDAFFSLQPVAGGGGTPSAPAACNVFRRIGSAKTDGASNWTAFIQDGRYFRLLASVLDVSTNNPGTLAVTATLASVPTGVTVQAFGIGSVEIGPTGTRVLFGDLVANDEVPSANNAQLNANVASSVAFTPIQIRTNTSAQLRYRSANSDASTTVQWRTYGWWDFAGKDN